MVKFPYKYTNFSFLAKGIDYAKNNGRIFGRLDDARGFAPQ